jgi:hypothetical protein
MRVAAEGMEGFGMPVGNDVRGDMSQFGDPTRSQFGDPAKLSADCSSGSSSVAQTDDDLPPLPPRQDPKNPGLCLVKVTIPRTLPGQKTIQEIAALGRKIGGGPIIVFPPSGGPPGPPPPTHPTP